MYYIVYKTTCLINDKIYIGVHKTETPNDFDGYIGCGISPNTQTYLIKHPRTPLHYALRKYGINQFVRETLYVFETEKEAYEKEAELVNDDFINSQKTYNALLGGRQGGCKPSRPVYYFSKDGILLGSFKSSLEASKSMECSRQIIDHSIQFKVSSNNYLWSRSPIIDISEYKICSEKLYYVYDTSGTLIGDGISKDQVLEIIGNITNNFTRSVKCQYKLNGYFVTDKKLDKISLLVTKSSEQLNRYSIDGTYIDSFHSVKEAKEKLGLSLCSISSAIKSRKSCNGFYWTRTNTPEKSIEVGTQNIKKQVEVIHISTGEKEIFESVASAAKKYKSVRQILSGRCHSPHDLKFNYKI